MMVFDLGVHYLLNTPNFGGEINPHLGILFVSGLFFGPYGILGAVLANLICDLIKGYIPYYAILSEIMSFLVAYLAYKLWFSKKRNDANITKLRLNNTYNMLNFFMIVLLCGLLYSVLSTKLTFIAYPNTLGLYYMIGIRYFVNFVNFSMLFSIIGIWLSRIKYYDFTPKISDKKYSKKMYRAVIILILLLIPLIIISDIVTRPSYSIDIVETVIILLLMAFYITKPIEEFDKISYIPIPEKIMDRFLAITIMVLILGIINVFFPFYEYIVEFILDISADQTYLLMLLVLDVIVTIFFIPSYFVIRYIEEKVVNPLVSFSKIESKIRVDEKIELNDLIDVYSTYTGQDDEIGMLSRSHVDLVQQNNNYIENIKRVESEKQRIKTELDIAHRIQESILPKNIIKNDSYQIKGFSKAAREVGGDFYDYFEIDDEHLVFVIGDSSGKGVPAALFTTITQNSIQQHCQYVKDPAQILFDINNMLCKNNTEYMFITLWLGIYNKNNNKLSFANAGHNRPLIKSGTEFRELISEKKSIVMGLKENYQFKKEEIILHDDLILYTDGITDARNTSKELYGLERLINFLNNSKDNYVDGLIEDVEDFCGEEEQYDDMTLLYLKVEV